MKIDIYCYLIADILKKKEEENTEMFLEWSSTKHTFLLPLNWLVTMATTMQNLRKNIQKSTHQKLCGG